MYECKFTGHRIPGFGRCVAHAGTVTAHAGTDHTHGTDSGCPNNGAITNAHDDREICEADDDDLPKGSASEGVFVTALSDV